MKYFVRIMLGVCMMSTFLMSAPTKYDKTVQYGTLFFNDENINKASKTRLINIVAELQDYQNNAKKMKIELLALSNDVGEYNADYVKGVLNENGIKKKNISLTLLSSKDEDDVVNDVKITLYVTLEQDKDNDGVLIDNDKCPNTPLGAEVAADGCRVLDEDKDGVLIDNDKCPDTPNGFEVDSDGCKILDKDQDGVLIDNDKCPNTPLGAEVTENGCQIPDKDQDGVLIGNDKCPNTPLNLKVDMYGCQLKSVVLVLDKDAKVLRMLENANVSDENSDTYRFYLDSTNNIDLESKQNFEKLLIDLSR